MRHQRWTALVAGLLSLSLMMGGCGDEQMHDDRDRDRDREESREVVQQEETMEETTEFTFPTVKEPELIPGYTTAQVRVRCEPNAEAEIVCTLDAHTDVQIMDYQDGWYQVQLPEGEYYISAAYVREKATVPNGYIVVIDPGHQIQGNFEKEPVGPGSDVMKYKVSSGTQGRFTGLPEYELNLMVALKLQVELENRGYTVIMTRTTHEVDISNSQRADIANAAGADVFIRIHANGSDDPSVNGALTICQTPTNPHNGELYPQSRALSDAVLDGIVAATGCKKLYVWETDTMSGINWCQVPVTIVEMGFMTNQMEDELLATSEYQYLMVQGMANGIDAYLSSKP